MPAYVIAFLLFFSFFLGCWGGSFCFDSLHTASGLLQTTRSFPFKVNDEVTVTEYLKKVGEHDPTAKAIRAKLYDVTVPCTTRPMRPGEVNGTHYNFVSRAEFDGFIKGDRLIEYGEHNGVYKVFACGLTHA